LEMLANVNLAKDLKIMNMDGRVCVIGSRGPIEIDPRDAMGKRSQILGVSLWLATEEERKEIYPGVVAGLANSTLVPVVAHSYPLAAASDAHVAVIAQTGGALGKIILLPHSE